jgi:hypothetical protein
MNRAVLERVRLRAAAGADLGDLRDLDARSIRTVQTAASTGAPMLDALDAAAAAAADSAEAARAIEVAASQARTVATGLLAAPLLLVPALGGLLQIDLLGYYRTPLGVVTAAIALLLLGTGAIAIRRLVGRIGRPPRARDAGLVVPLALGVAAGLLVHIALTPVVAIVVAARRRRRPPPPQPGIDEAYDLVATAVAGGLGIPAALRAAAQELPDVATPLRRLAFDLEVGHLPHADELPAGFGPLVDVLTTADAIGAPVGPSLRRAAADARATDLARVLAAAQRLPVHLVFPTALCLLPGVLLLIGAPIVHAGLSVADLTL